MLALLIQKSRDRVVELDGREAEDISIPVRTGDLEWMLRHADALQEDLLGFTSVVHNKHPQGRLAQLLGSYEWLDCPLNVEWPVLGRTVFTDAGRKMRWAACAWKENDRWKTHIIAGEPADSLQTLKLRTMIWALQQWSKELVNVVSDSLYVVGVAQWIHDAEIRRTNNEYLGRLLITLRHTLQQRTHAYCILHIRSHQWNIGLGEGNARADEAVTCAPIVHPLPASTFEQATP
ncbi:PREDICTED: uncharacterized protein LOC108446459 [Corvus brachyrhynchos]|uniref:uncharacterized protein LOC108446459 n=1 Tax=Corvus brachyrhynchos TaxID=85066 RepID=UPI0008167C17|nr:PREDICTED: uncharacterized protein LOC108446459 [Corvus brachyrhynchos]